MQDALIRSVAVVGGGLAGWMSAAVLARALRGRCSVALLDCDAGPMEPETSTLPQLAALHAVLGIDETDMVRKTRGTFRLGTEFVDWGDARFFVPVGELGPRLDGVPFLHYWLKLLGLGERINIGDYSLCTVGARANRFVRPATDQRSVLSTLAYAYQLDTAHYTEYLRAIAMTHGVVRREGQIDRIERQEADGGVAAVVIEGGDRIEADLFIDCTGPSGRLVGGSFTDWSQWLPCDSIVTASRDPLAVLPPYAHAMAAEAGWQWQIALQHRTGYGYVYSSRHIDDDKAAKSLLARLGAPPLGAPRHTKFTSGRRDQFWVGNVVAIGPAAAILDPLEGSTLHIAQAGIMRLLTLFPDCILADSERVEYNRLMINEVERLRDFLVAHYKTSARRDTHFWRQCAEIGAPESLEHKLKLFRSRGRIVLFDEETFSEHQWGALLLGQGVIPTRYDPQVDTQDVEQIKMQCRRIQSVIRQGADSMPLHSQFIEKFFAANR